ncbi:MAG: hypothetical protein Q8M76_02740, partial [Spirochaetaceae bacterium]|nr:hypothetical protein [Spirochaetaceae bacterium]
VSKVFSYTSISEAGGIYSFEGSDLKVRIEGDTRMTVAWKDEALSASASAAAPAAAAEAPTAPEGAAPQARAPDAGLPAATAESTSTQALILPEGASPQAVGRDGKAVLVVLSTDIRESIRLEDLRRQRILEAFADLHGTSWASLEGGLLSISRGRRFTWTDRGPQAQALLAPGATETGDLSFRLQLAAEVQTEWEGTFSLRFDTPESAGGETVAPKRLGWTDFVYRFTEEGMALAPAAPRGSALDIAGADPRFAPLAFAPIPSAQ